MVIVRRSTIHGMGVFATKDIPSKFLIECDVLEIQSSQLTKDYEFPFIGNRVCLHIGFGSFLNSSKKPNVKHMAIDTQEKVSYFEALVDIKKGDELFLCYYDE